MLLRCKVRKNQPHNNKSLMSNNICLTTTVERITVKKLRASWENSRLDIMICLQCWKAHQSSMIFNSNLEEKIVVVFVSSKSTNPIDVYCSYRSATIFSLSIANHHTHTFSDQTKNWLLVTDNFSYRLTSLLCFE